MKRFVLLICVLLFCITAFASDPADEFIERYMKDKKVPGLALLVMKGVTTVTAKGYGYSNLEHKVPVTPETVFQSGSVGKQFTATAIMILVQAGKIGLEDPIGKYLDGIPDSWKDIRIRHLLTHTSGLGDYPESFDFRKDFTEEEELKAFSTIQPSFAPGEKWEYSNVGYVLLGVIIRKASGQFYGDFLQEHVFQPLGMTATRVISEEDIIPHRAAGYRLVHGEIKNQEWVSPTLNTTADGALYFNILDLAKWNASLQPDRILHKSSLHQMWTPVQLNSGKEHPYGFGWFLNNVNGVRRIEHSGAWQGFTCHMVRYPNHQLTVVVLTNLAEADPAYVSHVVAGLYLPELTPAKHTEVSLDKSMLEAYTGEYQLPGGTIVRIQVEGNHLTLKSSEDTIELIPETETSFFVEESEMTVRFGKNADGEITQMIISEDLEATRIR